MTLTGRRVPLFWQILVPFVGLVLLAGAFGAFLVVRDLASRAQSRLDEDLLVASLETRATMQRHELALVESSNLAANLEGMVDAVAAADRARAGDLLGSVLALRSGLDVVAVTGRVGAFEVEIERSGMLDEPGEWRSVPLVAEAVGTGMRRAGFVEHEGRWLLVIATPLCRDVTDCRPEGAVVLGEQVASVLADVDVAAQDVGIAVWVGGRQVSARGTAPVAASASEALPLRVSGSVDGAQVQTLHDRFALGAAEAGTVAVTLPRGPAFATVRAAALRLGLVVGSVVLGIAAVGALVTRRIVRRIEPLVRTNDRLGAGELDARAPVVGNDEISDLASGLNRMAEQLAASHRALEGRVERRTAEIRRLLEERTEFFASLSHELRTPLAVVLAELDLLEGADDAEAARGRQLIHDSASGLLETVNAILELARTGTDSVQLRAEPVAMSGFVVRIGDVLDGLARRGEVALAVDVEAGMPDVLVDPDRLRDIVVNLVDNAVKYSSPGDTVSVGIDHHGGVARLVVQDTGPGIPPEVGDRIFEPFYQVPGASARGASSGLGLAIAARLVAAHGGTLTYTSEVGAGTSFAVALPLAP